MDRLDDLEAFLAIVEQGNQTAAAKHLRRSLQSIGRSLVALERSVGVPLVRRTTRRSSPTEAGVTFYRRLKPALAEIEAARGEIATQRAEPAGMLRIAAPVLFAATYVVPTVAEFLARYPRMQIELRAADRKVDVYEGGFDLAVRVRELPDSQLKVRRLGALRIVVFGAPAYFAKHGRPRAPEELARHACVIRNADSEDAKWAFRVRGKRVLVRVNGRFKTDDTAASQVAVLHGLGIGRAPLWQIQPLIAQGKLELILEDYEPPKLPIVLVSPASKQQETKARLFAELLASRVSREQGL